MTPQVPEAVEQMPGILQALKEETAGSAGLVSDGEPLWPIEQSSCRWKLWRVRWCALTGGRRRLEMIFFVYQWEVGPYSAPS